VTEALDAISRQVNLTKAAGFDGHLFCSRKDESVNQTEYVHLAKRKTGRRSRLIMPIDTSLDTPSESGAYRDRHQA